MLAGLYVYFGMHIVQRGVIFVDLSLAQVAALGVTFAMLFGFPEHDLTATLFGFGAALIAAFVFTATKRLERRVPQEAIIGIVYAVAAAAVVLAVSHSPDGSEHIRHLLVGSLLTATEEDVTQIGIVFLAVALFHWIARKRFLELSFDKSGKAFSKNWDFLFYATFALAVTVSVRVTGVLLIFIYLVAPAVFASLRSQSVRSRLVIGWIYALIGSMIGLTASVLLDTPSGATIVCAQGLMLLAAGLFRRQSE
jgi:zinc/manganese transport system permease protein